MLLRLDRIPFGSSASVDGLNVFALVLHRSSHHSPSRYPDPINIMLVMFQWSFAVLGVVGGVLPKSDPTQTTTFASESGVGHSVITGSIPASNDPISGM